MFTKCRVRCSAAADERCYLARHQQSRVNLATCAKFMPPVNFVFFARHRLFLDQIYGGGDIKRWGADEGIKGGFSDRLLLSTPFHKWSPLYWRLPAAKNSDSTHITLWLLQSYHHTFLIHPFVNLNMTPPHLGIPVSKDATTRTVLTEAIFIQFPFPLKFCRFVYFVFSGRFQRISPQFRSGRRNKHG